MWVTLNRWSTLLLVIFVNADTTVNNDPGVVARPGHYPPIWCQVSDVVLSATSRAFMVHPATEKAMDSQCHFVTDIWPIRPLLQEKEFIKCDEELDEGHVFTIFYYAGGSNYYHLNYDMMIPLYQTLYHDIDESPGNIALLPSVETRRLKVRFQDNK